MLYKWFRQFSVAARLRGLRYSGQEYFWVNDLQARMLMHPMKPQLDGQSMADTKDPDGVFLFREFVKVARADPAGGFVSYQWPKPGSDKPQDKVSFVKGFTPWGWVVGSGLLWLVIEAPPAT